MNMISRLSIRLLALFLFGFAGARVSPAATHIVVYGDSGVYGKGVSREEAYPAQLQRMLRQKGYDVTVTNAGENGATSADALANIGSVGKADVVVVQFGVNDAKHGVSVWTTRRNMDAVVFKLKERGAAVVVVGCRDADLSRVASARGAPYVMWGRLPGPQYYLPGDPHFNAVGLQVMASRILPAVERVLGSKRLTTNQRVKSTGALLSVS